MTSEEVSATEKSAVPVATSNPEPAEATKNGTDAPADTNPKPTDVAASGDVKSAESSAESKEVEKEKKPVAEPTSKSDKLEKKEETPSKPKRGRVAGQRKAAATPAVPPSPAREGMRRDRKKVERLSEVIDKQYQLAEQARVVIPSGNGTCLKDCPRIVYFMHKSKPEDLKLLHSLIFNRSGKVNEVRKNLFEFHGFDFTADSKEFQKLLDKASGKRLRDLKKTLYVLDIDRSAGNSRTLAERICRFLLKPSDNGKKPPAKLPAGPLRGRGRKRKSTKATDTSESEDNANDVDMDDVNDESDNKPSSVSEDEEEEDAPKPKKARRQSPAKRRAASAKKKPAGRRPAKKKKAPSSEEDEPSSLSESEPEEEEEAPAPAKEKKKKPSAAKEEKEEVNDDDDDEDDDDIPLTKLKKPEPPSMPTDDEIKKTVTDLLKDADMESLTVKGVINQVFAKYEGVELSDRKDFIRETIKQALN